MARIRMGLLPGPLLALTLTLAVGACSGGGGNNSGVASLGGDKPTSTTSPGRGDPLQGDLAFVRCMRQHGITSMPDPKVEADGTVTQAWPDGLNADDPKLQAARQACQHYREDGGETQRPNPQQQQQLLAFARCMRQHGINFPDPTPDGGVELGDLNQDDPKFKAAERACPGARPKY